MAKKRDGHYEGTQWITGEQLNKRDEQKRKMELQEQKGDQETALQQQLADMKIKLQGMVNKGAIDQRELVNQGLLTQQEVENAGQIELQGVKNEGVLDKQVQADKGALERSKISSSTAKDVANIRGQTARDTNTHLVNEYGEMGAVTNQRLITPGGRNPMIGNGPETAAPEDMSRIFGNGNSFTNAPTRGGFGGFDNNVSNTPPPGQKSRVLEKQRQTRTQSPLADRGISSGRHTSERKLNLRGPNTPQNPIEDKRQGPRELWDKFNRVPKQ